MFSKKYKHWIKSQQKKNKQDKTLRIINQTIPVDCKINGETINLILSTDSYIRDVYRDYDCHISPLWTIKGIDILKAKSSVNLLNQKFKNQKIFDKLYVSWEEENQTCFAFEEKNLIKARELIYKLDEQNLLWICKEVWYLDITENIILNKEDTREEKELIKEFQIKYFIDKKGISVPINTTQPELIFADVAIAVNPKDRRYKKHIGKDVIIPIINKTIPVIWDEEIDPMRWTWVFRVNPGHCKEGFEFAKKHNLPTNIKAINNNWKFTEICWEFAQKNYTDFYHNVIKYLQDIDNLKLLGTKEWISLYAKQWDKKLIPYLINSLFIKDEIENNIIDQNTEEQAEKTIISKKWISQQTAFWFLSGFFCNSEDCTEYKLFSTENIIQQYTEQKSKDNLALTLLITNLMMDNLIWPNFELTELVEAMLSSSFSEIKINKSEIYIDILSNKYPDKKLQKELIELKQIAIKIKEAEDVLDSLEKILEQSFLIKSTAEQYQIETSFTDYPDLNLCSSLWLSNNFLNIIQMVESIKTNPDETLILVETIDNKTQIELLLKIAKVLQIDTSNVDIIQINQTEEKKDEIAKIKKIDMVFADVLKNYDSDVLRLLMFETDYNDKNSSHRIEQLQTVFQKIWNGFRYIYNNTQKETHKNIDEVIKAVSQEKIKLTAFDIRAYYSTMEFITDTTSYLDNGKNKISKWIEFVNSFFDIYVQSFKQFKEENTSDIILLLSYLILNNSLKIVPIISDKILTIFDFWQKTINIPEKLILEKDYKAFVFMDIINNIKTVKQEHNIPKHEKINIQIFINNETRAFFETHKDLAKQILNIENLFFVASESEITNSIKSQIFDIPYWISIQNETKSKKTVKIELLQQVDELEQELQRKKILLTKVISNLSTEQIQTRRNEIEDLKKQIEDLKDSINSL